MRKICAQVWAHEAKNVCAQRFLRYFSVFICLRRPNYKILIFLWGVFGLLGGKPWVLGIIVVGVVVHGPAAVVVRGGPAVACGLGGHIGG